MEVYLDNSATTKPIESVIEAVSQCLRNNWYNPSALYAPAMHAEKMMNEVRSVCLHAVGADGHQLVFTGSGTEADNIAILGFLRTVKKSGKVLMMSIEHPAVTACKEEIIRLGHTVIEIPVTAEGLMDIEKLDEIIDENVILICIMQVNNETGAIQPIEQVVGIRNLKCPNAAIHVDGVQGFLRVPINFSKSGIQSYSFSGHKIHALKGIGGLIIHKSHKIQPIVFGGGQERGFRSGTENIPGIAAIGMAVKCFPADKVEHMALMKKRLYHSLKKLIPCIILNGPDIESESSAPHIINISFQPVRSQTMLFALEGDGIYVSAGSACASKKQKVSPILTAMGIPSKRADCALRFSFSPSITEAQIDYVAQQIVKHYSILSKYVRR